MTAGRAPAQGTEETAECTTAGCENPASVWGIYEDADVRQRVVYCRECADVLAGEFTPDAPIPAPSADLAALLDRLDAAHAGGPKRKNYPSAPWLEQNPDEPQEVQAVWSDEARAVLGEFYDAADAAAIVAAHNAWPHASAALRAVLNLADEMERRGSNVPPELHLVGTAYRGSGQRLRAVVAAALTTDEQATT